MLLTLPDELILMILSHLSSVDLMTMFSVCRRLSEIAKDKALWKLKTHRNIIRKLGRLGLLRYAQNNIYIPYHMYKNCLTILDTAEDASQLFCKVFDFYLDKKNLDRLLAILKKGDLEKYEVYMTCMPKSSMEWKIYKNRRDIYRRFRFNPYRTGMAISYHYDGGHVNTTIGQLNYFKWVIENNLDEKICYNYVKN